MYDLLKREDINWRELDLGVAAKIFDRRKLKQSQISAFVLDDSIKKRRGKKMESVSSHFDHVGNTSVMGHQVLTLGMSCEKGFMPVDSQISISKVLAQGVAKKCKNGRSAVARRYDDAIGQTKVQIAKGMTRRAIRHGITGHTLWQTLGLVTKR